jgi:hypothetical protein
MQLFYMSITMAAAATEMTDMQLDKAIKQELEPMETEEIGDEVDEDNRDKQEEEGKEEQEQESNDDIPGTGLEEENIMIDDNYSSDDDVPLELPFDNMIPFP